MSLPSFLSLGARVGAGFGVLARAVGIGELPEVPELGEFLLPGFGLVKAGVLPLSLGLSRVLLAGVSQAISLWHSQYRASMDWVSIWRSVRLSGFPTLEISSLIRDGNHYRADGGGVSPHWTGAASWLNLW